jgi:hypothetical protein
MLSRALVTATVRSDCPAVNSECFALSAHWTLWPMNRVDPTSRRQSSTQVNMPTLASYKWEKNPTLTILLALAELVRVFSWYSERWCLELCCWQQFNSAFMPTTPAIFNGCWAFINSTSLILRSGTLRWECSEIWVDGQTGFTKCTQNGYLHSGVFC